MDSQEMALLFVVGGLLVALFVVNTAEPVAAPTGIAPTVQEVNARASGAPRMGMTTAVFVYDPVETMDTVVEEV